MSVSATEISQLRQQLTANYHQLPETAKQIVRLFSVIYAPVTRNNFLQCFNQLGVTDNKGKQFVNNTLRPYLENLLNQELLIQEPGRSPQCNPLIVEIVTRDAIAVGVWEDMVEIMNTCLTIPTRYNSNDARVFNSIEQLLREIRVGIYRQDLQFINHQLTCYEKYSFYRDKIYLEETLSLLLDNPFDPDWFNQLPQELFEPGLAGILSSSVINLFDAQLPFSLLKNAVNDPQRASNRLRLLLVQQLILRDDIEEAKLYLAQVSEQFQESAQVYRGWLAFISGDCQQAIALYTAGYKFLKQGTKKKKVFFSGVEGLFFILALLQDGSPLRLKEAENYAKIMAAQSNHWLSYTYGWLLKVLQIQQGDLNQKEWLYSQGIFSYEESNSLETLFCSLCLYWVDAKQAKKRTPRLLKLLSDQAERVG